PAGRQRQRLDHRHRRRHHELRQPPRREHPHHPRQPAVQLSLGRTSTGTADSAIPGGAIPVRVRADRDHVGRQPHIPPGILADRPHPPGPPRDTPPPPPPPPPAPPGPPAPSPDHHPPPRTPAPHRGSPAPGPPSGTSAPRPARTDTPQTAPRSAPPG